MVEVGNVRVVISADTAQLAAGLAAASGLMKGFGAAGIAGAQSMGTLGTATQSLSRMLGSVGPAALAAGGAVTILGAGLIASVKAAVSFETAWVGAMKTLNGSDAELAGVRDEILAMSTVLPVAATELARLAQVAGQLGVSAADVSQFVEVTAKLGATTELNAETAAISLARLDNIMSDFGTEFDVEDISNAIVALGNNFALNETELTNMTLRLAGAAEAVGITTPQVLGLSTAMKSLGLETESGATAFQRTFLSIETAVKQGGRELENFAAVAGMTSEAFASLWEEDPGDALFKFVEGLGVINDQGGDVVATLDELGLGGQRVLRALLTMSAGTDEWAAATRMAMDEIDGGTALLDEFGKQADTTGAKLKILGNNLTAFAIGVGTPLNDYFVAPGLDLMILKVQELNETFLQLMDASAFLRETAWSAAQQGIDLVAAAATRAGEAATIAGSAFDVAFGDAKFPDWLQGGANKTGGFLQDQGLELATVFGGLSEVINDVVESEERLNRVTSNIPARYDGVAEAARNVNTLSTSLEALVLIMEGIDNRQDAFQFQAESLAAATVAADAARVAFNKGEISIQDHAEALGVLNKAYAQSGVTADQAIQFQSALVAELAAAGATAELTSVEIDKLAASYLLLSPGEIKDLSFKGLETWAAANAEMGKLAAEAARLEAIDDIVMIVVAETGQSKEDVQEVITLAQNFAEAEYGAPINIETDRARANITELLTNLDALTGEAFALVFEADTDAVKAQFAEAMALAGEWDQQEVTAFMGLDADAAAVVIASMNVELGIWDAKEAFASLGVVVTGEAEVSDLNALIDGVDEETRAEILASVTGTEDLNDLVSLIARITNKSVVIGVAVSNAAGGTASGYENEFRAADGAVVDYYRHGGLRENHVAQIAPAGAMRVWAEPETGGEAYIPLSPSKRARSSQILSETASRMGKRVINNADGNLFGDVQSFAQGGTTFSTSVGLPTIAINVSVDAESLGQVGIDLGPVIQTLNAIGQAANGATTGVGALDVSMTATAGSTAGLDAGLGAVTQNATDLGGSSTEAAAGVAGLGDELANTRFSASDLISELEGAKRSTGDLNTELGNTKESANKGLEGIAALLDGLEELPRTSAEMARGFIDGLDGMSEAAQKIGRGLIEDLDVEDFIQVMAAAGVASAEALTLGLEEADGKIGRFLDDLIEEGVDFSEAFEKAFIDAAEATELLSAALGVVGDSFDEVADSLDDLSDALDLIYGRELDLIEAGFDHAEALRDVAEAAGDLEGSYDGASESSQDLFDAFTDLAEAGNGLVESLIKTGASSDDVDAKILSLREEFIELATAAGLPADVIDLLLAQFLLFPDEVKTEIIADAEQAARDIADFEEILLGLTAEERVVVITAILDELNDQLLAAEADLEEFDATVVEAELRAEVNDLTSKIEAAKDSLEDIDDASVEAEVNAEIDKLESQLEIATDALISFDGEEAVADLKATMEDLEAKIVAAEEKLQAIRDSETTAVIKGDIEQINSALVEAESNTLDFVNGEYVVTLDGNPEPIVSAIREAESNTLDFVNGEYVVTLGGNVEPVLSELAVAEGNTLEYVNGVYVATIDGNAQPAVEAAATATGVVTTYANSGPHSVDIDAVDNATSVINGVKSALGGLQSKSITLNVTRTETTIRNLIDNVSTARGLSNGGILNFADGSEEHIAQIADAGTLRIWAEPETGGEAYIPLGADKRVRSLEILEAVADRFGRRVVPMAHGGILNSAGGGAGSRIVIAQGAVQITVTESNNPRATARAVDDQITQRLRGFSRELATSQR